MGTNETCTTPKSSKYCSKYKVTITVGDCVCILDTPSGTANHYAPLLTGFSLLGLDDKSNESIILSYEDQTAKCNSDYDTKYIEPKVYRNCSSITDGNLYAGWVVDGQKAKSTITNVRHRVDCTALYNFGKRVGNGRGSDGIYLTPYFSFSCFYCDEWVKEENNDDGEYGVPHKYRPSGSPSESTFGGSLGIQPVFSVSDSSYSYSLPFYFASCSATFTDLDENGFASKVKFSINVYDCPTLRCINNNGTSDESDDILNFTPYLLMAHDYSFVPSKDEAMLQGGRSGDTNFVWYGTLSADCSLVVYPEVPDLLDKKYDGTPFNPVEDFPQIVPCYVKGSCDNREVSEPYGCANIVYRYYEIQNGEKIYPETIGKDVGTYWFEAHITHSDPDVFLHHPTIYSRGIDKKIVVDVSAQITQRQISFALVSDPPLIEDKVYDKKPISYNEEYHLDKRSVIVGGDGFAPGDEDSVTYDFTPKVSPFEAVGVGNYQVTLRLEVKCDPDFAKNYNVS